MSWLKSWLKPSEAGRWFLLAARLCAIGVSAAFCARLPLPIFEEWLPLKNVVVAAVAVVLTGRTLYDTFFYERFRP